MQRALASRAAKILVRRRRAVSLYRSLLRVRCLSSLRLFAYLFFSCGAFLSCLCPRERLSDESCAAAGSPWAHKFSLSLSLSSPLLSSLRRMFQCCPQSGESRVPPLTVWQSVHWLLQGSSHRNRFRHFFKKTFSQIKVYTAIFLISLSHI